MGSHLVGHLHGVLIHHIAIGTFSHQTFQLRTDAENTDLHALAVQNRIGLDHILQNGLAEIVIGTHNRELSHLKDALHILQSEIKLMVADRSSIIVHAVHQTYLHLSVKQIIISRSLRKISGIKQQQVRILTAHLLHKSLAAQVAALVGQSRIGKILIDRHHTAVRVVGVQHVQGDYRVLWSLCTGLLHQRQTEQNKPKRNISSYFHILPPLYGPQF